MLPDPAQQIRHDILDRVIVHVRAQAENLRPALVTTLEDGAAFSPDAARREIWTLFDHGFSHLKEWSPGQGPGSISGALAKTTLRSSAMAASLGIPAPVFAETDPARRPLDPKAETLFLCAQLVKISADDVPRSQSIVMRAIEKADLNSAFNIEFTQKDLQKLFNAAGGTGDLLPQDILPTHKTAALRQQMLTHFNMMAMHYQDICRDLERTIKALPAAMSRPQGGLTA